MDDLTGQTLGGYDVYRRLGRGAMAEVYLAGQRSLGRQVALKVLNAELARDETYVARFQREAQAAASLVHGNIVQVYEVGVVEGRHFIAQEYVAGSNLGEVVQREGRLAPGLVLDVLRQVTAALCRASEVGIVHRDIKPENLMLARSGEVKVADFGLARATQHGANLTSIGVTMGTPLYMSPEQVEGRPVDARADLYSLGVTAYHLLAGDPPFVGDTPLSVAVQHLNNPPPPLLDRCPEAPVAFASVVERMMAKAPSDRPDSPVSLVAELRSLATQAAEQGWAVGPESWSIAETVALAHPATPATQELGELMGAVAELKAAESPGRSKRLPLAVFACLLAGAGLAWVSRPAPLLSATPPGPAEKETVLQQIFHAKLLDTEAAWEIIPERFPDADTLYLSQAKEGLARHYLTRGDHVSARPLFAQLGALDGQATLQLVGQAGAVICDVAIGDHRRAERTLNNGSLIESLPQLAEADPDLYARLQSAREQIGKPPRGG